MLRPHIVILGAGFGGVYLAKKLSSHVTAGDIDVTIISRTNYFLFTPLLHEVATGSLGATSVAEPLREVFAKSQIRVIQADVQSINSGNKTVTTSAGIVDYDYLVVATGADTNYYGIPGAEKFCLPLKNLTDASKIRARVIDSFEQALLVQDPKKRLQLLSFAIVGGGATGVETTAELADFVTGIIERYYHDTKCDPADPGSCRPEEAMITLVHTGTELLQQFHQKLRTATAERLKKIGVKLQFGSTVTSVTKDGLVLANNTTIPAHTVIWAAGVKANIPHFENEMPVLTGGRLSVDEYFRLAAQDRIFALGDVAAYMAPVDIEHKTPQGPMTVPLPMLAQVAVQQADVVAYNLLSALAQKPLRAFSYHSKGSMVSVGQLFAIGEIFSLNISGKISWFIWRTVYLFKFASWKKRFRIMFDWTLDLFYPRDITKLN